MTEGEWDRHNYADESEGIERSTNARARRLGIGAGIVSGWTRAGHLLFELARAGKVARCVVCGKPLSERLRKKKPYHHSRLCSDLFYEHYYRSWGVAQRVVRRRDGYRCAGYGAGHPPHDQREDDRHSLEFDHVHEIAAGGDPFDPRNIQLLCHEAHLRKTADFMRRGTRLFGSLDPAQTKLDQWAPARTL